MGAQKYTLSAYNFLSHFYLDEDYYIIYMDSLQFPTPAAVVQLTVNSIGVYIEWRFL